MNALTFKELKARLGVLIERDNASTHGFLDEAINEAYVNICNTIRLKPLEREFYIQTVAEYTSGTVAVNAAGTTVTGTGTTFTEAMIGRIIFLSGAGYVISGYTSATEITIDRPYESTSNLTDETTSIVKFEFPLPYDCDYTRIYSIKNTYTPARLKHMSRDRYTKRYPNPTDVGDPLFYVPIGYKTERFPSDGTYNTSQAGTNTTTVVLNGSPSGVDDYYNHWHLINKTRELVSRVTDYAQSTKTLTVSPAVASQTDSDEVAIEKKLPYLLFYPFPDDLFSVKIIYYTLPNYLINDWDLPILPDRYHELIYKGAALNTSLILEDDRRRAIENDFGSKLNDMAIEYGTFEEDILVRRAIDDSMESDDYTSSIYNFPLSS